MMPRRPGGEHLSAYFRHGRRGDGTLMSLDAIASLALLIKGTRGLLKRISDFSDNFLFPPARVSAPPGGKRTVN